MREYGRLTADLIKGEAPRYSRQLAKQRETIAKKNAKIAELQEKLEILPPRVDASRLVWIFSSGRSGTTWIMRMFAGLPGFSPWNEPRVGWLYGNYLGALRDKTLALDNFVLGEPHADVWLRSLRNLVLEGAASRFPERIRSGFVVVKEPNGSIGAPHLVRAIPRSRVLVVVRDPRDVCASMLDGRKPGGWQLARMDLEESPVEKDPDAFVAVAAGSYAREMGGALKAYEEHAGLKSLVRYEDLRSDALGVMRRIVQKLELPVKDKRLERAVRRQSWEMMPEDRKGPGQLYRKARPGSWREDLTPAQARMVENKTRPFLEMFYPEETDSP